ncbi:tripartite tricarboxylate transporter TctB family protein [Cytobacillus sp. S13-E01]|uniref:tripartite tricarboxylate transporter TctB family protein n=1 Tax=Cytobacillus sp. S13-E01 TaxID=3031326 RepID=UPI0023D81656|nr:tripartite tricarboxylate transporter TctB family protein [Cytobacillus sp. S13-E01]MDF0726576.1 tripartite tricarboxylate transporter TctB family protein [Cytobacillus sp. S13-E01]
MANNRIVSIGLLVFCGFFYYQTTLFQTKDLTGITAAFFPRVILSIIAILSVVMLIKSFFVPQKIVEAQKESEVQEKRGWIVWILFALFGVYVILIQVIGFITSSFLFMSVVYLLIVREKRPLKQHLVAIGGLLVVSVGISMFFQTVLQVFLPRGVFF